MNLRPYEIPPQKKKENKKLFKNEDSLKTNTNKSPCNIDCSLETTEKIENEFQDKPFSFNINTLKHCIKNRPSNNPYEPITAYEYGHYYMFYCILMIICGFILIPINIYVYLCYVLPFSIITLPIHIRRMNTLKIPFYYLFFIIITTPIFFPLVFNLKKHK